MNSIAVDEEEPLLICPYCESELVLPDDMVQFAGRFIRATDRWLVCKECDEALDLPAQLAFERGRVNFSEGQELLNSISPRKRQKTLNTDRETEAIRLYISAYTAVQEAFHGELEENQRQLGIRMMTAMANQFTLHNMVSPLEASYWGTLLVEVNTEMEIETLKEKLGEAEGKGLLNWLAHLRQRVRLHQLQREQVRLDNRLRVIEQNIEFVDPPHARKSHPKRRQSRF